MREVEKKTQEYQEWLKRTGQALVAAPPAVGKDQTGRRVIRFEPAKGVTICPDRVTAGGS